MPPLRPVSSLQKLCFSRIASHLLDVFSSWYTAQKDEKLSQGVEEYSNRLCHSDVYKIKGEFALDNCYRCECYHGLPVHENDNVAKNKWLIKVLTDGRGEARKFVGETDIKGLAPVPIQHETETPTTVLLTNKMKDFLIEFARPFMQDILSTLLDLIAQRVKIPRPTEKTSCYDEDLDFINSLGFFLRVSVTSLLSKTVNTLNFSSVSHLLYRWMCEEVVTLKNGRKAKSPYFDIFGYALDITLPELRTLKYLKVPHCVQNNLVRKVAFLCPSLETLILRCSPDCPSKEVLFPVVTDVGVLYGHMTPYDCPDGTFICLRGCRNLVTLELPEHDHELDLHYSAFELVILFHKLECLIGASMINVHQYRYKKIGYYCSLKPTKLTNFHHEIYRYPPILKGCNIEEMTDRFPNNARRQTLSKVFPQVKEVWLNASDEDIIYVLKNFPHSEKMTLYQYDPREPIPLKYWKNLTSLNIDDRFDSFTDLRESCPNLQELTIRSNFLPVLKNDRQEKSTFPNLHTLKFDEVSTLEPDQLLTILAVCPGLLHFELALMFQNCGSFKQLDVTTLQSALPYLEKLQKFVYKVTCFYSPDDFYYRRLEKLFPCELTMGSLRSLISYCPDLKYVGQLGRTWKVTLEEVNALKEKAKVNNWDLEIVW